MSEQLTTKGPKALDPSSSTTAFQLPRAVIPPLDDFTLAPPSLETPRERARRRLREAETPDQHARRMINEFERRFGGRVHRQMPWEREQEQRQEWEREANWPREARWLADLGVEPDWGRYGFRGQVGRLLYERGLKKKAIRFVSCNKCGRPGVCRLYPLEHKFFVPHGCEVVFCRECQQEVRRALFDAYLAVILTTIYKLGGIPPGWVLARVNFTLRSDGSEIAPERVKKMNSAVRLVMRTSIGSPNGFGMLYLDEVGFELRGRTRNRTAGGLNLHCHGLYLGPRINWQATRDLWVKETQKRFGVPSTGFFIKAVRIRKGDLTGAIRHALNHMLKYVSKPPAVTPERLASLIAAFNGAKRVHALGLFYGKKPRKQKKDCPCPKCRTCGIVSTISFEGRELSNGGCVPRLLPMAALRELGYEPLREAGRTAVLTRGETRAP
jgi:hypothetical protein